MTPELAYFLKINVAIALFYAFYRLFFYKDTFFHWRRTALLCFFGVSLLYPLLNMQEWIKSNEPMVAIADLYATMVLPELVIHAPQEASIDWQEVISQLLTIVYWVGTSILILRMLIQLGSIIRLHFQCPQHTIKGVRVHILRKGTGPFSFFNWIFVHPESHTESELSEIITHEKTHAHQYHSIDVLISEVMCIFCWFNPFIWLMKREVRGNLEYMADHRVLETGHDCKSYQYHLLGLAHHKAAANLSNSFNVLPLKNRIKMMNKRRTKEIGRTKYLMFIPLAALLMIISNIEIVARTTKDFAKGLLEQSKILKEVSTSIELPTTATDLATLQDKKVTEKTQDKKVTQKTQEKTKTQPQNGDKGDVVFEMVEEMPQFPGGVNALMEYLSKNIKYPVKAQETGTQGRIITSFVVRKDGSITDVSIARGVDADLDKEALRVVSTMPKWQPGKQKGQAVSVKFTVPIMFRLNGPKESPKAEEIKNSDLSEIFVVGLDKYGGQEAPIDVPVRKAEKMPSFPGGEAALMAYIAKNMKYPTIAQERKEQGKVVIEMTIGKDGSLSNLHVVTGVSAALNAEAIRVLSGMPKWEPGMENGNPVAVQYTIPVSFRLQ